MNVEKKNPVRVGARRVVENQEYHTRKLVVRLLLLRLGRMEQFSFGYTTILVRCSSENYFIAVVRLDGRMGEVLPVRQLFVIPAFIIQMGKNLHKIIKLFNKVDFSRCWQHCQPQKIPADYPKRSEGIGNVAHFPSSGLSLGPSGGGTVTVC